MRGLQSGHLTSRSRLPHGYGFKMAQFIRRRLDDDATDFSTTVPLAAPARARKKANTRESAWTYVVYPGLHLNPHKTSIVRSIVFWFTPLSRSILGLYSHCHCVVLTLPSRSP